MAKRKLYVAMSDLSRHLVGEPVEVSGLMKTFITERPLPDGSGKRGRVDVDDAAQVRDGYPSNWKFSRAGGT